MRLTKQLASSFDAKLKTRLPTAVLFLTVAALVPGNRPVEAADVTWSLTDFNSSTLNLSGTIHQAVNFSATSRDVTIGSNTVTFAASPTIIPVNADFPNGPNETAAGAATYTNVVGNAELLEVLRSHSWSTGMTTHTIPLSGLTVGVPYEIQAFMHDGRGGTGCGGIGCGNLTLGFGDDNGISTALVTRNSGAIGVGTFIADAATQNFVVGGGQGDASLSGYLVRVIPEPSGILLAVLAMGLVSSGAGRRRAERHPGMA